MPSGRRAKSESRKHPPAAKTPELREQQMISLADELAEKQLREGTASAQVITHYLKLASSRERLEQARIKREIDLLEVKKAQIASMQQSQDLFEKALAAMSSYQPQREYERSEDEYDD